MSNRPNYVLKLADGTERVFTPHPNRDDLWVGLGDDWTKCELEALGATPVPEPKPKAVEYAMEFYPTFESIQCNDSKRIHLKFKSHEDAENYRKRCESIGPPWTDWEPKHGQMCYWLEDRSFAWGGLDRDYLALYSGLAHPTKERAQEWLDEYGKAWGLK